MGVLAVQQPVQVQLLRLEEKCLQLTEKHPRPLLARGKGALLPHCWNWLNCVPMGEKGRSQHWGWSCLTCSRAARGRGWPLLQCPAVCHTRCHVLQGLVFRLAGGCKWFLLSAHEAALVG